MTLLLGLMILWAMLAKKLSPPEGAAYVLLLCCLAVLNFLVFMYDASLQEVKDGPGECWSVECLALNLPAGSPLS